MQVIGHEHHEVCKPVAACLTKLNCFKYGGSDFNGAEVIFVPWGATDRNERYSA